MQIGQKTLVLIFAMVFLVFPLVSHADYYSCYKKVYADGWLKKYEYKGQTWGANTKKSGLLSSSVDVTIENTTTSVDPGVSTGELMSSVQYSSSWGECAAVDMLISKAMRDDYIKQNLHEIKKQVAVGDGYHVDSLAFLSGCKGADKAVWTQQLQSHTGELYDSANSESFRETLDTIIRGNSDLNLACHPPA